MSGLAQLIRDGLAIAKTIVDDGGVMGTVQHSAWTGQDYTGAATYATAAGRKAIIEQRQRLRMTSSGKIVATKAYIAFLEPVPANGASGRQEPIDTRDKIVLPDGTTGQIVDVAGLVDASTTRPYYSEVWLGDQNSQATVRP